MHTHHLVFSYVLPTFFLYPLLSAEPLSPESKPLNASIQAPTTSSNDSYSLPAVFNAIYLQITTLAIAPASNVSTFPITCWPRPNNKQEDCVYYSASSTGPTIVGRYTKVPETTLAWLLIGFLSYNFFHNSPTNGEYLVASTDTFLLDGLEVGTLEVFSQPLEPYAQAAAAPYPADAIPGLERWGSWTLQYTGTLIPVWTFTYLIFDLLVRYIWPLDLRAPPPAPGTVLSTPRDPETGAVLRLRFAEVAPTVAEVYGALGVHVVKEMIGATRRWETFSGLVWSQTRNEKAFELVLEVVTQKQAETEKLGVVDLEAGLGGWSLRDDSTGL